jgi:hypothetical protein
MAVLRVIYNASARVVSILSSARLNYEGKSLIRQESRFSVTLSLTANSIEELCRHAGIVPRNQKASDGSLKKSIKSQRDRRHHSELLE